MPRLRSLRRSVLWQILSKALLRSIRTIAVNCCWSIALKIWPVTKRLRVSAEWFARFSLWCWVSLSCLVRKSLNWIKAIFSATLEKTGSNEIGQLLLGTSWSPSFRWGTITDFFQALGNLEQANREKCPGFRNILESNEMLLHGTHAGLVWKELDM